MLCKTHGTPMRETCDALSGADLGLECEACELERQATAREKMALKDTTLREKHLEIAAKYRAKAQLLSGRWFEVAIGGTVRDMSEHEIEIEQKKGTHLSVLTEII